MPNLVDTLLFTGRQRRRHRIDHLGDRRLADIGMPHDQMRRVQPFLLGSMVSRSG